MKAWSHYTPDIKPRCWRLSPARPIFPVLGTLTPLPWPLAQLLHIAIAIAIAIEVSSNVRNAKPSSKRKRSALLALTQSGYASLRGRQIPDVAQHFGTVIVSPAVLSLHLTSPITRSYDVTALKLFHMSACRCFQGFQFGNISVNGDVGDQAGTAAGSDPISAPSFSWRLTA
jgi:hypothetical protein